MTRIDKAYQIKGICFSCFTTILNFSYELLHVEPGSEFIVVEIYYYTSEPIFN